MDIISIIVSAHMEDDNNNMIRKTYVHIT